ncbi:hypothetical protein vseg_008195 [Gypsophila vaccaria]
MKKNQNHILTIIIIITIINLQLIPLIKSSPRPPPQALVISPHCTEQCGDITVPYPFGIEEGCYYVDPDQDQDQPDQPDQTFKIKCNQTTTRPEPTLYKTNTAIINISLQKGEIQIKNPVSYDCYDKNGHPTTSRTQGVDIEGMTVSSTKNKLVVFGCDTYAWFTGERRGGEEYYTGCMTKCSSLGELRSGECSGVGCCEGTVPAGVTKLRAEVYSFRNHVDVAGFNPCGVGFVVEKEGFEFERENVSRGEGYYGSGSGRVGVVMEWGIGRRNCGVGVLCGNNSGCLDFEDGRVGYRCGCLQGYFGNPYVPRGCLDIDECEGENECEKAEYCHNTDGSYFCECPTGYYGNGTITQGCIFYTETWLTPVIITAGIGGSIIVLLVIGFLVHRRKGKREIKQLRENFFRQNGGLILHQKLSRMDVLKIFTAQDLEYATNNYDENNIIGRGGFGVVYKGVIENNQKVAIKRSIQVDPDQVEQFINEVIVLSQINNRNVVKLLGCCLETEVPLLVYEFINNGTLYDHLHNEARASSFTWSMRLGIASEVAEVLAYLHTTISTPIIHRDMKSMNILLDESYTAKVADFGASKLVPIDHGQLATMVLGTLGYLDPEYMQTSELTEKSDVYSFGVVMVELLTRKTAISYQRPEAERCLSRYFLLKMKEDRLFDIVDKYIGKTEGEREQVIEVANLARWCLRLKGDDRPTMKEVARELEGIKRSTSSHPWYTDASTFNEQEDHEHLLARIAE